MITAAFLSAALGQTATAPTPKPLTKTTVADKKFGESGTYVTYSDDKLRLDHEEWLDGSGKCREYHIGNTNRGDFWAFYWPDGTLYTVTYTFDPMYPEKNSFRSESSKTVDQHNGDGERLKVSKLANLYDVDRKEVEEWVESIERQLSKKADFQEPWLAKTKLETPVIAPVNPKEKPGQEISGRKCVVGSWVSEAGQGLIDEFAMKIGSEGLALEVGADGSSTLKYDGVKAAVYAGYAGGDSKYTTTAQGTARAKLEIGEQNISVSGDVTSSVKLTEKQPDGSRDRVVEQKTFFPAESQSVSYTCSGDALVIKLNSNELKFKRVNK